MARAPRDAPFPEKPDAIPEKALVCGRPLRQIAGTEALMNDIAHSAFTISTRDKMIVMLGVIAGGAILFAFAHGLASGAVARSSMRNAWLALHLVAVLPALPLGAYVLVRRKGDALHRALGKLWAALMLVAALSSFGLRGMTGSFSAIHLLSALVLVMVPRGVLLARSHRIAAHRRVMSLTYLGLALAGLFTLLPGRLLGGWLFT